MAMKIVIAEDAPFLREVLRNYIEKLGHELVGEAEDGEQAVTKVLAEKPDIVLMDIVMPKKNGIEATKEILLKEPGIKIVACSTIDQEHVILEALEAGCCNYMTKPFTAGDLSRIIEALEAGETNAK
jgi:two-component system, chemotaxis family, chemotaxis protein CheY